MNEIDTIIPKKLRDDIKNAIETAGLDKVIESIGVEEVEETLKKIKKRKEKNDEMEEELGEIFDAIADVVPEKFDKKHVRPNHSLVDIIGIFDDESIDCLRDHEL